MIKQEYKEADIPTPDRADQVLCVDLDGTLLSTDLLWESALILLKKKPWALGFFPFWLVKGKAHFKRQLSQRVDLNEANLPFRQDVLKFLYQEKEKGREIVLVTASEQKAAEAVVEPLSIFSKVVGSNGKLNLRGPNKRQLLEERYGYHGFDYIGDSSVDLSVWEASSSALLVEPSNRLVEKVKQMVSIQEVFRTPRSSLFEFLKALRVYQWVKNFLIFVPVVTAHKIQDGTILIQVLSAFFAFSFCASGIYVLNDLLDLQADRQHPKKKLRPFAAGKLSIPTGLFSIPLLLISGFLIAFLFLTPLFTGVLTLYVLASTVYSLYFKRIAIGDIIVLAALYSLRVLAGGVATDIPISAWLLAFSMFLFLSLAIMKRYTELNVLQGLGFENAAGRGYLSSDKDSLQTMGTVSGYLSVLVFALYINSEEVVILYRQPKMLWLICPLLLYWISRLWFRAHRGQIDDDPVIAIVKDPFSYAVGATVAVLLFMAL